MVFLCVCCNSGQNCQTPIEVVSDSQQKNFKEYSNNVECKVYAGVKGYFEEHMHNFESYEPVKFGRLFRKKSEKADSLREVLEDRSFFKDQKIGENPDLDTVFYKMQALPPAGFRIAHKYRGKTLNGNKKLSTVTFHFDTAFKVKYMEKGGYIMD